MTSGRDRDGVRVMVPILYGRCIDASTTEWQEWVLIIHHHRNNECHACSPQLADAWLRMMQVLIFFLGEYKWHSSVCQGQSWWSLKENRSKSWQWQTGSDPIIEGAPDHAPCRPVSMNKNNKFVGEWLHGEPRGYHERVMEQWWTWPCLTVRVHAIDLVLLNKAKRRRYPLNERKDWSDWSSSFDYPPIRSLRECPCADPADLSNLFFTEEQVRQWGRHS